MHRLHLTLLLGLIGASAASAQFVYDYKIDSGLDLPVDVAVYRECDPTTPGYVFVADRTIGLARFDGDGSSNIGITAPTPPYDQGPFGVAVDDSISSPHRGRVYTTDHNAGNTFGLVWIHKDTSLVDLGTTILDGPTGMLITWAGGSQALKEPKGIAVDRDGNLYVADPTQNVVVKVDAADFDHQGEVNIAVTASLVVDTIWAFPQDVSVDKAGRIHVTHPCGCLAVFHPDGSLFGASAIFTPPLNTGVDAKDDHLNTRTTLVSMVSGFEWDIQAETFAHFEDFGAFTDPQGLEFQKYWRDTGAAFVCEDRVFVADAGTAEILVFSSAMQSLRTPKGAVAFWRFDGADTLQDSALDNDIVISGTVMNAEGRARCGMEFQNVPTIVGTGQVADHASLDFGTGDFSVEGWICADLKSGVSGFLDKRDWTAPVANRNGFSMFLMNGYLGFQLMSGGTLENHHPQDPGNFVADGKWHHVAATVQRTVTSQMRMRMYVDGVLTDQDLTPILGTVDNDSALILGDEDNGYGGLSGVLDEITLYNRELYPVEVSRIFQVGCAGKHDPGLGVGYCGPAEPNSTGMPGLISATGSDLVVDNDLTFSGTQLPVGEYAVLLVSPSRGGGRFPGVGSGLGLCVGAPFAPLSAAAGSSDAGGTYSTPLDLLGIPTWQGPVAAMPGESWYFQVLYRDGGAFLFTDALEITFQ